MVTHLRMQEERSLLMENNAHIAEKGICLSENSGWQFSYLDYLPKRSDDIDLRTFPQRKPHTKPNA
jgi:hypothetical protein